MTNNCNAAYEHACEVEAGNRFEFGSNWSCFLQTLSDERIEEAKRALMEMLGTDSLQGKSFIDIGSGSGLSSLAARLLGASVYSFDYDPQSVACTKSLKERYFPHVADWQVHQASVLDKDYLSQLGTFDVVYSWGVLHHTGQMWQALENVSALVKDGGMLFIAIYNDQGSASRMWTATKKVYNRLPGALKWTVLLPSLARLWGPTTLRDLVKGKPFHTWRTYRGTRGMSAWHDVVDWVGGYPFEVAKPEEIFDFYRGGDFELLKLKTCAGGHGCNEFIFKKK